MCVIDVKVTQFLCDIILKERVLCKTFMWIEIKLHN